MDCGLMCQITMPKHCMFKAKGKESVEVCGHHHHGADKCEVPYKWLDLVLNKTLIRAAMYE
jgi:hypothetical protein